MSQIPYADFINSTAPAATGVWNSDRINENKVAINSKADAIGSWIISTVAPTISDGQNGQYWYNTTTKLLHLKSAGTWNAGNAFALGTYEQWVIDGRTGPNGLTTLGDFLDDQKGEAGTSNSLSDVSVMPTEVDDNTLYLFKATPVPTVITTASGVTYTIAQLLTGSIGRDCNGLGRTDTLPTAALVVAGLVDPVVNQSVECFISNWSDAAETITLAVGTGGSWHASQVAATRVIPQFHQKSIMLRLTNVGSGTEAYVAHL